MATRPSPNNSLVQSFSICVSGPGVHVMQPSALRPGVSRKREVRDCDVPNTCFLCFVHSDRDPQCCLVTNPETHTHINEHTKELVGKFRKVTRCGWFEDTFLEESARAAATKEAQRSRKNAQQRINYGKKKQAVETTSS